MTELHAAALVAVVALVTLGLRFAPFLLFREKSKTPPLIAYLGRVLPYAIMGMLVVYCLKDVDVTCRPFGIPEVMGCALVALLHVWTRNTLLSIGVGTVCYMLLVQFVF